jgi:hypothetical protein
VTGIVQEAVQTEPDENGAHSSVVPFLPPPQSPRNCYGYRHVREKAYDAGRQKNAQEIEMGELGKALDSLCRSKVVKAALSPPEDWGSSHDLDAVFED